MHFDVRKAKYRFLSTPSARRATDEIYHALKDANISIHALREEGDLHPAAGRKHIRDFYPRPPRGGRRPSAGS